MKLPTEGIAEEHSDGIFTRYVRALITEATNPQGDAPGEIFDEMWRELHKVVRGELRRRSLWSSSPAFVGVHGWESWHAHGADDKTVGPLEEFLAVCYSALFDRHLERFRNQLHVNPSIDGLVMFYLRNFLTECQKVHDPLGYRLFEILRAATGRAVDAGELHVLRGQKRIRNDTILGSSPGLDPHRAAPAEELRPHVERWNHELLPGLVTAGGKKRRRLEERLREHLFDLEAVDISVFRFKDLLDPLKHDVRARWAQLYDQDEGESLRDPEDSESLAMVRLFRPRDHFEEWDSFKKLVGCIADRIEALDDDERTNRYLGKLWGFLRRFAVDENLERLPSRRKLADLLHIPRERFGDLFTTLAHLARWCREALGGTEELSAGRRDSAENSEGGRHG